MDVPVPQPPEDPRWQWGVPATATIGPVEYATFSPVAIISADQSPPGFLPCRFADGTVRPINLLKLKLDQ